MRGLWSSREEDAGSPTLRPSDVRVFERLIEYSASRPVGLTIHNILSIRVCKRRSSDFHGHDLHASTCTMNPQQS
jgi:hypothetical protein